jgi:hypothetical protein
VDSGEDQFSATSGTTITRDPLKKVFDRGCVWVANSRLPPIITATKTLKRHLPELLAYAKDRVTNAMAKGTNGRIQLIKANALGLQKLCSILHCYCLSPWKPRSLPRWRYVVSIPTYTLTKVRRATNEGRL